jgi:phosphate transport system protein
MSELQNRLNKVLLRLDHMGMRVEQAVADVVRALEDADATGGREVDRRDSAIDREEVEIEQECIRLLALYQPAAIDLRTICTIIKVNSDLERIADLAANIGRQIRHLVENDLSLAQYPALMDLAQATVDVLGRTVRMLSAADSSTAEQVIQADAQIDEGYRRVVQSVLAADGEGPAAETVLTMTNLAKALERIGDHCTNIAEDIIFLRTGDIIRHAEAFEAGAS